MCVCGGETEREAGTHHPYRWLYRSGFQRFKLSLHFLYVSIECSVLLKHLSMVPLMRRIRKGKISGEEEKEEEKEEEEEKEKEEKETGRRIG